MLHRPQFAALLSIGALLCAVACTDDITSGAGSSPSTQDVDTGDAQSKVDVGDSDDAAEDAHITPPQDVEEPDTDAAAPDAQLDPSDWESDFDVDEDEVSDDADLYIGPEDRRARVLFPDDMDGSQELPVVFLFHGFTATSGLQDAYFGLSRAQSERDFILVLPDGLQNPTGQQYWNATDFCCDMYGEGVDDVAYFRELLDEVLEKTPADADRVHLMGHSNGHFFSNRLACEVGSQIASVVGVAGSGHWDADNCQQDGTVSTLHIHGSNDAVIAYSGVIGLYPGAQTMGDRWGERNGCSDSSSIYSYTSLDAIIWGLETVQRRWRDCPEGIDVELWTIMGGSHTPVFLSSFADKILDFALPRTNPDID